MIKILTKAQLIDFQVRRSFLEELGVVDNWTLVDMLFREFYTGSDTDLVSISHFISTVPEKLDHSIFDDHFWHYLS